MWKVRDSNGRREASRRGRTRRGPAVEPLEGRALLSADYVLSGTQWPNPAHITYSIAPDGVAWDMGTNNLNAAFNAEFGDGPWQRELARALATWEDVANINIAQVGESGAWPIDAPGQTQGDPRFGDIRFGGANFNDNQTLAQSFSPPVPGFTDTSSGNVEINTAMPWHIGSDFDLYSVMLHETGLTLGLSEPPPGGDVVMNTVYGGVRSGLMPGDIAGIQAIYGPRTPDVYQSQGQGTSFGNAVDLSGPLGGGLQATLSNVSLATIGDTEYFSITAPANSGGVLSVTATAAGISLLSPQVTVYNASGQALAQQGNPSAWGDAVSVQVGGVTPGQRYVIAVTGATSDAFAAGAYQLQVAFPSGTSAAASTQPQPQNPSPVTPVTPTPTGPTQPVVTSPTSPHRPTRVHRPVRPPIVRHPLPRPPVVHHPRPTPVAHRPRPTPVVHHPRPTPVVHRPIPRTHAVR